MTDATPAAVDAFVTALREATDEHRAAALALIADDVEVFSPFGVGSGTEAAGAALANPRVLGLLQGADWSTPEQDGDRVVVTANAAAGAPVGGFRFGFAVDADGKIDRVEQDILPGVPGAPGPLALSDAHAELLANALTNGTTPIVAYVDADGVPHQSYRATVQVLDDQRLAIWIRDPAGGLLRALPGNPNVSVFYADRANGVTLQFVGRAHVDDTDAVRTRVFDASPRLERDMDWRRRGIAVVVDVDRVEGRDSSGTVSMAR